MVKIRYMTHLLLPKVPTKLYVQFWSIFLHLPELTCFGGGEDSHYSKNGKIFTITNILYVVVYVFSMFFG